MLFIRSTSVYAHPPHFTHDHDNRIFIVRGIASHSALRNGGWFLEMSRSRHYNTEKRTTSRKSLAVKQYQQRHVHSTACKQPITDE